MGYVISGRMKIVMDDGEEDEFGPGDFMSCAPGHDAAPHGAGSSTGQLNGVAPVGTCCRRSLQPSKHLVGRGWVEDDRS